MIVLDLPWSDRLFGKLSRLHWVRYPISVVGVRTVIESFTVHGGARDEWCIEVVLQPIRVMP